MKHVEELRRSLRMPVCQAILMHQVLAVWFMTLTIWTGPTHLSPQMLHYWIPEAHIVELYKSQSAQEGNKKCKPIKQND